MVTATILENFDELTEESISEIVDLVNFINSQAALSSNDSSILLRPSKEVIDDEIKTLKLLHLPKIRAKLAFLEIFASCLIPEAITQIISICPKYFGEDLVQQWLILKQWEYKSSTDKALVAKAKREMDMVFSGFKGDRRKTKPRNYMYWRCYIQYESLLGVIKIVRAGFKTIDVKKLGIIMDLYKIPKGFEDLILNGPTAPAELALEVMTSQGDIDSPKAFKDFQGHVSRLKEQHNVASADPFIQHFLDYRHKHLDSFSKIDIWEILEDL